MIQLQKEKDKVIISITSQLDKEDVKDLITDLQAWLDEPNVKFHNPEHQQAFEQAMSKRKLENDMKEYIASIKSTQHIQKEVTTIELDALNREVEVTKTKLKQNGK